MIGIVIGTGDWTGVACTAARRMMQMTGLSMEVITEVDPKFTHPSWMKSAILDWPQFASEDSFLVMDADIICLQEWEPDALFETLGRPFCAVPEPNTDTVHDECASLGIPFPSYYVNAGLTMFGREHAEVWNIVKRKHPKCGRWLEQGALNLALMHTGVEVCRLPRRFNVVTYRGDVERYHDEQMRGHAINLHITSMPGPQELRQIQESYGLRSAPESIATD